MGTGMSMFMADIQQCYDINNKEKEKSFIKNSFYKATNDYDK